MRESITQTGHIPAVCGGGHRKQGVVCETGHCVDLKQPRPMLIKQEVNPSNVAGADFLAQRQGSLHHGRGIILAH